MVPRVQRDEVVWITAQGVSASVVDLEAARDRTVSYFVLAAMRATRSPARIIYPVAAVVLIEQPNPAPRRFVYPVAIYFLRPHGPVATPVVPRDIPRVVPWDTAMLAVTSFDDVGHSSTPTLTQPAGVSISDGGGGRIAHVEPFYEVSATVPEARTSRGHSVPLNCSTIAHG